MVSCWGFLKSYWPQIMGRSTSKTRKIRLQQTQLGMQSVTCPHGWVAVSPLTFLSRDMPWEHWGGSVFQMSPKVEQKTAVLIVTKKISKIPEDQSPNSTHASDSYCFHGKAGTKPFVIQAGDVISHTCYVFSVLFLVFHFFPLTPVITQFISFTIAFALFPRYSEGILFVSSFQTLKAFILNSGAFST